MRKPVPQKKNLRASLHQRNSSLYPHVANHAGLKHPVFFVPCVSNARKKCTCYCPEDAAVHHAANSNMTARENAIRSTVKLGMVSGIDPAARVRVMVNRVVMPRANQDLKNISCFL